MLKISANGIKARLFDVSSSEILSGFAGFWAYQNEEGLGISDHDDRRSNFISIFVNYNYEKGVADKVILKNTVSRESDLNLTYLQRFPKERTKILKYLMEMFPGTKVIYSVEVQEDENDEDEYYAYGYEDEEDEEEFLNQYDEDEDEEDNSINYAALGVAYLYKHGSFN